MFDRGIFTMRTLSLGLILSFANYVIAQQIHSEVGKSCVIAYTNSPGICKMSTDCPSAKKHAQNNIRPSLCGFGPNNTPIVCCEAQVEAHENSFLNVEFPAITDGGLVYPEDKEPTPSRSSLSESKCREYTLTDEVSILPLIAGAQPTTYNITNCDYNGIPLIVGGSPALLGEFPFMAAIGWRKSDDEIGWNCGGSLISDQYVMTAAHCSYSRDYGEPVKVRLGELDFARQDDGASPVDYDIREIKKHPEYKFSMKYNDIALVLLTKKVKFTKHIRPACLWSSPVIQQNQAIATGWGVVEQAGAASSKLLKVALDVMPNKQCQQTYQSSRKGLPNGIVDTMLCAGELAGGKDTCQGDSGGPLFLTKDNQCIFHIIGITSFGRNCAARNTPAVYTRVSSYLSWIENTIW